MSRTSARQSSVQKARHSGSLAIREGFGDTQSVTMSPTPASLSPGSRDPSEKTRFSRYARWSVMGAGMASALVGFIAFAPALRNEFVYDDLVIIVNNPTVRMPGPWYRFWRERSWPRGMIGMLYRPLTVASYRANTVLPPQLERVLGSKQPRGDDTDAAPDPFWFHLVNLVIHGLTCTGVALLAYRLCGRAVAAWAAGLLFAVHPIHTEAIVTGYGRAELLAGFFAVWLMARYLQSPPPGWKAAGFHLTNAILFAAALMSKEHAIFVWPVLMLLDLWRRYPSALPRSTLREWISRQIGPAYAGLALGAALFFILRFWVLGWRYWTPREELSIWQAPLANATWVQCALTPLRLLWLTGKLCVWPPALSPLWSLPSLPLADRVTSDVAIGLLVLVLLLAGAALLWQKRSVMGPILLGLVVLLALPLQFIPITAWYFAERWLYLPTVLMAVAIGILISRWRSVGLLVSLTLSALLLPSSWSYLAAFHDDYTLVRYVLDRQPDNYQAMKGFGNALVNRQDYPAALQAADEMIARFGDVPEPYAWRARAFWAQGDPKETLAAIDAFHRAMGFNISFELDDLQKEARKALATAPSR